MDDLLAYRVFKIVRMNLMQELGSSYRNDRQFAEMYKLAIRYTAQKQGKRMIKKPNNLKVPAAIHEPTGEKRIIEDERWRRQSIIDKELFEERLLQVSTIPIEELRPQGRTLYIIGNGFDLMHGVNSSYRAFRDFLGKNSDLRYKLELYLKSDDIWADFEDALGHINMDMMANPDVIGDMLDATGFFKDDSRAAEYNMALEMAAEPMRAITEDLEKRFRMWIEKLEPGTNDRPLKMLFHDDKVLCFNYTEFVEELYGVSESNVCYIHGCRRRKKGHQREKLILGHTPGAPEDEYALIRGLKRKKSYRSQVIDVAQEGVIGLISEYDEKLTKDCQSIISAHSSFFKSLADVTNVFVIGHSISPVDWDYFLEVAKNAPDAHWYFGCHGIHDLENTQHLSDVLGINPIVFRTDGISVAKFPESDNKTQIKKPVWKKTQSPDRKWNVQWREKRINITGSTSQTNRIMQDNIKRCFFSPAGDILFVIINGLGAGIPFFRLIDGVWVYIDEMEPIPNQNLLNRRLRYVYLNSEKITFVYNNRVREYSLETGELVRNQARRDAKSEHYEGVEISKLFLAERSTR